VCTVVCRWCPDESAPVQLLALRDEFASRAFDLPGEWWADQPGVVGGRDRRAGGSWCVSDIATGSTAVVLNRPDRPVADDGAPSRGVLPLRAIRYGDSWPASIDVLSMASFNLLLVTPESLRWWEFDGEELREHSLSADTYLFTPYGLRPPPLDPQLGVGAVLPPLVRSTGDCLAATEQVWPEWLAAVRRSVPGPERSGLLVRRPVGDDSYETVFGQFIAAQPGQLRLDYLDHVAEDATRPWTVRQWSA
jgi:hypothetical protein